MGKGLMLACWQRDDEFSWSFEMRAHPDAWQTVDCRPQVTFSAVVWERAAMLWPTRQHIV